LETEIKGRHGAEKTGEGENMDRRRGKHLTAIGKIEGIITIKI
jgi:hypothetical protein